MMDVLKLENVNVFYDQVHALSDICLSVKEKDFLAIIGPNGGGKSTLLKTILGLLKPTSGKIMLYGKRIQENLGMIGYVPQFTKFNKKFPISVEEVVHLGFLKNKNHPFIKLKEVNKKKAEDIMKELNIFELRDRQIGQLSGGQLQRVLIARALVVEPKLLLLDEPTASLDANAKTQIHEILQRLNKEMTIVMVTHDMSAVSTYVKNIACLNQKLFYHGQPNLTESILGQVYGCPIDMIAHGVSHRVLHEHEEE
ncbi:metal ABC transporter ATP-binding protein [Inediibacterium massiliense]|uniref:metal ABC transporter ATP-binding protein n=1 Tax=Inediibacterium massiliense TaxID=1658111 RepID=UPI0006B52E84|nr:metal ABC transporter ATP-binding protein [Inediibacterium massiliense]